MLIDGEKWACEACIRGHRVSSCQHSDRSLSHINRKGRPMSQCPHCRGLRKSRANHVKCECGTKPHGKKDCKKETGTGGARKQCCCSHGTRCTCSAKKDSNLATVPERNQRAAGEMSTLKVPRLSPYKSEPSGLSHRHKPRKDASRHTSPYSIPRSHTVHSVSDFHHRSSEHLPAAYTSNPGSSVASHHDPNATGAPRPLRRAVSENNSPVPAIHELGPQVPAIDIPTSILGDPPRPSPTAVDYAPQSMSSPYVSDVDSLLDQPTLSVARHDWSPGGITYGSDSLGPALSQPGSYSSYDYNHYNQPERSPTGDASSVGDIRSVGEAPDTDKYRLSASSSYLDVSQAQFMASPTSFDGPDIDSLLRAYDTDAPPAIQAPSMSLAPEPQQIPTPQSLPMYHNEQPQYIATDPSASPYVAHHPYGASPNSHHPMWHPTGYPPATSSSSLPMPHGHMVDVHQWS